MTCTPFRLPDGTTGIACTRGQRTHKCSCGARATLQCDFKLSGKRDGQTCDAHICRQCKVTQSTAPNGDTVDYCMPHARFVERKAFVAEQLRLGE
jgi:hypothetical protein